MNILLVGCGKVGSKLAVALSSDGHEVTVIDSDKSNFKLLPSDFSGYTTVGIPIDLDVLRRAGIENCDAVAVVSSDDNTNIMVSQVAKEIFNIPIVITRIYDPAREDLFSHFGLKTICPTNITVSAVRSALNEKEPDKKVSFSSNLVSFSTMDMPKNFVGKHISDTETLDAEAIFGIIREGTLILAHKLADSKLLATDKIIIAEVVD